jgi:hypothetical protein
MFDAVLRCLALLWVADRNTCLVLVSRCCGLQVHLALDLRIHFVPLDPEIGRVLWSPAWSVWPSCRSGRLAVESLPLMQDLPLM